mgnify:CR=1 FL=1
MISLITGIVGLSISLVIVWLIRKDSLHIKHGLGWIFVAFTFSLLVFFPSIFDFLAVKIGIGYPPILALVVGFGVVVIKLLLMDIERSKLEVRHQRLIQRVALIETNVEAVLNDIPDKS